MTKQEILDAFIQAEKDWSEPIEEAFDNETEEGLCWYFINQQDIKAHLIPRVLRPIWQKYKTNETGRFDFYKYGHNSIGRAERLEAIRKVINDLQKEINETN